MNNQFDPRKALWRFNTYYDYTFCYYADQPDVDNDGVWHLHYTCNGQTIRYHQVASDIPETLNFIIHEDIITDEDVERYLSYQDKYVLVFKSRGVLL